MQTKRLIIIDENMNTIEFEINSLTFKTLVLNKINTKQHSKKRDLNVTITDYLDSFKTEEQK